MSDQQRSILIAQHPIKNGLNGFRATFTLICHGADLSSPDEVVDQLKREDVQDLASSLLTALQILPAARLLPSNSGGIIRSDLLRLISAVASNDFDLERIKPLLKASIVDASTDEQIWNLVDVAAAESTPPPRTVASSLQQTPWLHKTSSFANSSEYRQDVDRVLKTELGPLYVGLPHFHSTFFGHVSGLQSASAAVFKRCTEGKDALFAGGWKGWPEDANQDDVLTWFADLSEKLGKLSNDHNPNATHMRRPLAQPNKPIQGSTAERKLDIGFVSDTNAGKDTRCQWSQILVPGELKANPSADTASKAWLDLGRIWVFDRLGGVASDRFDINEDGPQFVSTILGFLCMNQAECGFDPTIIAKDGRRFIEIEQNGQVQRLVLEKLMKRAPCIAGRATTCWKAHREEDPGVPFVVKDSWQYTERDEEGDLLQEATERGVVNVARYYHHATVCVHGKIDDAQDNVRGGLDIRTASNYRPKRLALSTGTGVADALRNGRNNARSSVKRSSSQAGASLPPSKRSCSASPTKASNNPLPNRVHRRVIMRDYGEPIYKASTRQALLAALEDCIAGHQSLQQAGILHRDISVNNLMINEDKENPSWRSFLIDLDLAIREKRDGKGRVVARFDKWNFVDTDELAGMKKGEISDEADFVRSANEYFTEYYQPLIPCINTLRKVVFPNGRRWAKEDLGLYDRMKAVLRGAQEG
ncbi:hypothetical protein BDV25DRAFT_133403 [Aspergillus avenaceus]|uniref:non-specific serine/threonine protein kinase n=1 Tax=Aspergillus avenaceus TaxID=36643 RepID=A0A5N6THL9_ASPAV|nr:hypothetical protein BDV25DRAFT_133403 [Aspergillus avenaceus]